MHADDYAISIHASQDILDLIDLHKLDSISIIPNMPSFDTCMKMLTPYVTSENPLSHISVHLNFMEGHCCSDMPSVPALVDERGYFKVSWGGLLLASYNPFKRETIKNQLKIEMAAQIDKILVNMPDTYNLEIDSHQHTHMIPVVWDALKEVIYEKSYSVQFLRLSKEPLSPFLKAPVATSSYGLANIIKNILLNWYGISIQKQLQRKNIPYSLLWGLLMSGHMDADRIKEIDQYMQTYLAKEHQTIEMLFHPGVVLSEEITEANVKPGFVEFHLSKNRLIENEAVRSL